ncbi:hypothetical protein BDK51DRAFT_42431, partial [Blyttiomyces helicus]
MRKRERQMELEKRAEAASLENVELKRDVSDLKEMVMDLKHQLLLHNKCSCNIVQQYLALSSEGFLPPALSLPVRIPDGFHPITNALLARRRFLSAIAREYTERVRTQPFSASSPSRPPPVPANHVGNRPGSGRRELTANLDSLSFALASAPLAGYQTALRPNNAARNSKAGAGVAGEIREGDRRVGDRAAVAAVFGRWFGVSRKGAGEFARGEGSGIFGAGDENRGYTKFMKRISSHY